MRARVVAVTALAILLLGCQKTPELIPRLILQGEDVGEGFWLGAPLILVVRITQADQVGPRKPIVPHGPQVLQLVRFRAEVENVLEGELRERLISFYFVVKVNQATTYYLDPGKRYVVSLRREGGILRSWADATQLRIWIHSGRHQEGGLPRGLKIRDTIEYVLLTPGEECDLRDFAENLDWWPFVDADPGYIHHRLNLLEAHPDRAIRDAACLASASLFRYRPNCLSLAVGSPDGRVRETAQKLLRSDDSNLSSVLRKGPFALFPAAWTQYMSDTFEIYNEDLRPEVRNAACRAERVLSPQEAHESCK